MATAPTLQRSGPDVPTSPGPARPGLPVTIGLTTLALLFTAALTFVTIELPNWLTRQAERWIDIPDYHPAIEPDAIDEFMADHRLRLIGWVCLGVVAALIIGGLLTRQRALSGVGAVLLFLPTFGFFASYMFFLAGLGILRVLWLPVWSGLLALGDVAYLPYMAVVWPLWQLGLDARHGVAYAAIAVGLFLFIVSTAAWFMTRSGGRPVAEGWLYRYSRHPQYLGWILWTYGLMLLAGMEPVPFGGENPGAALPWVVSTLVIIGVAWAEESRMLEQTPAYVDYQQRTPFLFPVPRTIGRLVTAPLRLVVSTEIPRTGRQLVTACALFLGLALLLSLPFALFEWPALGWWAWPR